MFPLGLLLGYHYPILNESEISLLQLCVVLVVVPSAASQEFFLVGYNHAGQKFLGLHLANRQLIGSVQGI
jgi:hypothetical protein